MKITIYRTRFCSWCHKTEEFLKAHKIKFKSIDVGEDHRSAMEMIEKSGQQGVPVIDVDGEIVIGFDEPRLRKLLKISS